MTGELGNYWTTVTVEVREDVIIKRHLNEESPTPFTATTWVATDTITGPYESKYEDTMDAVRWAIRELLLWHAKANRR